MTPRQIRNLIFHKDSIALVFSLIFLWFSISLYIDSSFRTTNLIRHTGRINNITNVVTRVKNKPFFKESTKELRITLDTEEKYFTSITTEPFGNITSRIKVGDTITIFTKPKVWGIFGLKHARDISQLTKNDKVIMNFANYKRSISGFFIPTFIFSITLLLIYLGRTTKRYHLNIVGDP